MMHGRGKSDPVIVAVKPTNNAERSAAEPVEPRAEAKGNANQQSTCPGAEPVERVTGAGAHRESRKGKAEGPTSVSPSLTRGGSRMRESCTYGSVRGARGNSRPYRDPAAATKLMRV